MRKDVQAGPLVPSTKSFVVEKFTCKQILCFLFNRGYANLYYILPCKNRYISILTAGYDELSSLIQKFEYKIHIGFYSTYWKTARLILIYDGKTLWYILKQRLEVWYLHNFAQKPSNKSSKIFQGFAN